MAYCETCSCGRSFTTPGAIKNHQNACTSSKKRLSDVLENARALFATRKAKRLQAIEYTKQSQSEAAVTMPQPDSANPLSEVVSIPFE